MERWEREQERKAKEEFLSELFNLPSLVEASEVAMSEGYRVGGWGRCVYDVETYQAFRVLMLWAKHLGSFSGLAYRDEDGQIKIKIESNFGVIARYKPLTSMPDNVILARTLENPEVDLEGRLIPEKYLAGLPPRLRAARVRELTQSRSGRRGYEELPTDIEARRLGITRKGQYTAEAERRGIEHRSDFRDTARRAFRYYQIRPTADDIEIVASELEKVFRKGLAAWQTGGHRPGASQRAWGYARVASVLTGGKAAYTADRKNVLAFPKKLRDAIHAQRMYG